MSKLRSTGIKPIFVIETVDKIETEDLFEKLRKSLGCSYISDMKVEPYCSEAKALLKGMDINDYSLSELNDVSCYLYGLQFATKELVLCFLKG